MFIAAIVFSGCAGGAGGSSADAEEEGTIALKLSAPATGSRSARAAESIWNTATGTFSVSLKSDLYSDTQSVELSTDPDSPRSITFKSVPVGLTVTISATFTGTFDGAPETKTYSDRVTKTIHSGSNVITLNMTEDGGSSVPETVTLTAPVASVTCTGAGVVGVAGTGPNEFYLADETSAPGTAQLEFTTATEEPEGTCYLWYVTDGSASARLLNGTTSTNPSYRSNVGAVLNGSGLPATLQVHCVARKEGCEDAVGDPITILLQKKSIPAPRITYSKTDYTSTSVAGCASVTFQIQNIADFTGLDYTAAWTFTAVSIKRSTGNVERTATLRSTEKSVTIDKSTSFSVAGGGSDRSMVVGSSTRLGTLKAELTVTVDGTPYTATAVTLDAVNDLGYRTSWDSF